MSPASPQPDRGRAAPPLYILAGGASRRFGSDKAMADQGGRPMLRVVAEALGPAVSDTVLVVDRPGRYGSLGYREIVDKQSARGPLGGLETALLDRIDRDAAGWLVLASCDLIAPRPGWIEQLLTRASPGTQAVAYRGPFWEPLLTLYHTGLLAEVRRRLAGGERSMQRLLDAVQTTALPMPDGLSGLPQANTPAELAYHTHESTERRRVEPGHPADL